MFPFMSRPHALTSPGRLPLLGAQGDVPSVGVSSNAGSALLGCGRLARDPPPSRRGSLAAAGSTGHARLFLGNRRFLQPHLLQERCWGRTGGEEQPVDLTFYPRAVKWWRAAAPRQSLLTMGGPCKPLTTGPFSPPARAAPFSRSGRQSWGPGRGQGTPTQSVQQTLL